MTTTEETPMQTMFEYDTGGQDGRWAVTVDPHPPVKGDLWVEAEGPDGGADAPLAHGDITAFVIAALTHGGWGPGKVEVRDGYFTAGDTSVASAEDPDYLRRGAADLLALAAHIEDANAAPPPDPAVERVRGMISATLDANDGTTVTELAARIVAAVRGSGAPAPEPEQAAPVAVGDRVDEDTLVPPGVVGRSEYGSLHRRAAGGWQRWESAALLTPGRWLHTDRTPPFPLTVTVVPAAEREADAAGESGAGA